MLAANVPVVFLGNVFAGRLPMRAIQYTTTLFCPLRELAIFNAGLALMAYRTDDEDGTDNEQQEAGSTSESGDHAWRTRFSSLGARLEPSAHWTFVAQYCAAVAAAVVPRHLPQWHTRGASQRDSPKAASLLIFTVRRQTVDGQAIGHVVDHGEVECRPFPSEGIESKRASLARVYVVFAHELARASEFHDLARMQGVCVRRRIAVRGQQIPVRRKPQCQGSDEMRVREHDIALRRGRDFQRQSCLGPARCQPIRVSGRTTTSALRQSNHREKSDKLTRCRHTDPARLYSTLDVETQLPPKEQDLGVFQSLRP
jgi:hypothetical protein